MGGLQRCRLVSVCSKLIAHPPLYLPSAPEIFICYMMHESILSSHTTLCDPRPHLHRCNMTYLPPSILAREVDSMNFYYGPCGCHLVWLFLLMLIVTNVPWKCITSRWCHWEKKNYLYVQSCALSSSFIS